VLKTTAAKKGTLLAAKKKGMTNQKSYPGSKVRNPEEGEGGQLTKEVSLRDPEEKKGPYGIKGSTS